MSQDMQTHRLTYTGETGSVFSLWFSNLFLSILTLGTYRFWGSTKIRHYLVGHLSLSEDPFEYTGTGLALFLGFLKAFPLYLSFLGLFVWVGQSGTLWPFVVLVALMLFIAPLAHYMSLRYRLRRVRWRGIYGNLEGSAWRYALLSFCYEIFNILTLGLWIPFADVKRLSYQLNNCSFGTVHARLNLRPDGELLRTHIITWFLFIPTLGLSRFWYWAALGRLYLRHLTVGDIKFDATYTGWNLMKLFTGNFLIITFTFTLGMPWVIQRTMRYMAKHLLLIGDLDTAHIIQVQREFSTSGEGLESSFGFDSLPF